MTPDAAGVRPGKFLHPDRKGPLRRQWCRALGGAVLFAALTAAIPGSSALRGGDDVAPPDIAPLLGDRCDLPAALKWAYEKMSARRTALITALHAVPANQRERFRAVLDQYTKALNGAIDREIDVLSLYFAESDPSCGPVAPWSPNDVLEIEESKTAALRNYIQALSEFLPTAAASEVVETDLHLTRAIEVQLRNLAYMACHAPGR